MQFEPIFDFLRQLAANNTREWMNDHKSLYQSAKDDFEIIIRKYLEHLGKLDPELSKLTPKDCIFRLHRDIRFSADKTPYKTNFGASMAPGGRKSPKATYYLHIQPDHSFIAGGIYMPQNDVLKLLRQEIDYNINEFLAITEDKSFKKYFSSLEGESLKKAPKGYDPDHPHIDVLKHKHFIVSHPVRDTDVLSPGFEAFSVGIFQTIKPFNDFLNRVFE